MSEGLPFCKPLIDQAASRMSQLRKASSAASHHCKANRINRFTVTLAVRVPRNSCAERLLVQVMCQSPRDSSSVTE
jgi:hypothetical protein